MSITLPPLPRMPDPEFDLTHGYRDDTVQDFATAYATAAIEADRASRVPMTEAQLRELVPYWIGHHLAKHFELPELMRAVEAHHGIGAKP